MMALGHFLNSKARTEVLRALCLLSKPVGIRKLARLTRLRPRSVELALASLAVEGLVSRVEISRRGAGYRVRESHPSIARLRILFLNDERAELATRTADLARRGAALCGFMDEGLSLIRHARRSKP